MRTEMAAMRDGVRLATDVYLPSGAGPWPVILERTPYGRAATRHTEISLANPTPRDGAALAAACNARGYAVVLQDCRGRYGSEGRFVKYLADGADGADTCGWINEQPWCDGHICTIGVSYGAHMQAALGCLDPPGLVAQVLDSGGFNDAWASGARQGGAFELRQATWALREAMNSPEAKADPVLRAALEAEDIHAWFAALPWQRGHSPLRHHRDYEATLFEQMRHGARDGFWKQVGIWAEGFHYRYSRADCVHLSSWFDPYVPTATGNFRGLRNAARGRQRLVLGRWTHGNRSARVRQPHHPADRRRVRAAIRCGRPEQARNRAGEPRHQRPRSHARRRDAYPDRGSGQGHRGECSSGGSEARPLHLPVRHGHWDRHGPEDTGACDGAVLHHQGAGHGHRPRTLDGQGFR
jgi:hypothetical protein